MPTSQERLQIGRYTVIDTIGVGGMGTVYKALDESGQHVALKVLNPTSLQRSDWVDRFRREAQLGLRLRHDHLIRFLEWGELEGKLFLAMEFVDGPDLLQMIELHGTIGPRQAARILRQTAGALAYIWQEGIVHRDVKPSNILIQRRQDKFYAKLGDLGLARVSTEEEGRITRDGLTVGTIDYMSPEQARNCGAADIRSDLYSLGCTLFHMLTGRPPFNAGAIIDRIMAHAGQEAPDPREIAPDVPPRLAAICRRLLAKHPEQRYQHPSELLLALGDKSQLATESASSPSSHPAVPPPKRASRGVGTETEMEGPAPARPPSDSAAPASDKRIARFLFEQALRVRLSEQPDYALRLLTKCCRLDPARVEYHEVLREVQRELNAAGTQRPWWEPFARWLTRIRYQLAQWQGSPANALRYGESLLYWEPGSLELHAALARAAEASGCDELALWILAEARRIDRKSVPLLRALADFHEKRDQLERALECYEEMQELLPTSAQVQQKIQALSASQALLRGDYENRIRRQLHPGSRQVELGARSKS